LIQNEQKTQMKAEIL